VGDDLYITKNISLNSFCGIYPLISSNGLAGNYTVSDNLLNPTQQQIIDHGPCLTSVEAENEIIPKFFDIEQNCPNPFNPTTVINYQLAADGHVGLNVYNLLGEKVANLVNKTQAAGTYTVEFNGAGLPSGVYFYKIKAGNFSAVRKMIFMK
jgi:hypothetical protein